MAGEASALTEQPKRTPEAGRSDFALRCINFGEMTESGTSLEAYAPLAPSIWLGFEDGGLASWSSGHCENGSEAVFLDVRPGPSRWFSLELGLNVEGLRETGMAMAAIEAAATPRVEIAATLRLPTGGDTPFVELPRQRLIFGPQMKESFLSISTSGIALTPNEACPRPVLLLFMPLRELTICIRRITFGPAHDQTMRGGGSREMIRNQT